MLQPQTPALVLAPMEGITDAPMRALQGASGAFSYAVSEFMRVSTQPISLKAIQRAVPELIHGARTPTGMPVQVQLLGGDPDLMAESASVACKAGAPAIDLNFGCPAKTVNRRDGGASLLKYPERIEEIVAAVRGAVPAEIPVSAKLRLGWDSIDAIYDNARRAVQGGASWLTIHARTRVQGYAPPVFWLPIRRVREDLGVPVIANGDIWNLDDFRRCQDETGCIHYMIGRGALANPKLPFQIARELGMVTSPGVPTDWNCLFRSLVERMDAEGSKPKQCLLRLKQWMKLAHLHGDFPCFDELKRAEDLEGIFEGLRTSARVTQD